MNYSIDWDGPGEADRPDEIADALAIIAAEIKDKLGEGCDDFNPGCLTCQTWRAFSDLDRALFICKDD